MALRVAVASGNWSNPAIWNSGVIPGPNDIVASNTYTVTIDQNITVDTLTNTAQTKNTIVPIMTSNTIPSGIASSNVGVAWQAFDNDSSYWLVQTAQVGDYVQYQFPTARAVDQYSFTNGTSFNGSVSLQGSNNGINFTTLHTASVVITPSGTYESPLIGNSTLYLYYRFVLNSAIYVQITFVRFFEYLGTVPAAAGGGFVVSGTGYVVTCTSPITTAVTNATPLLTISSTGTNTFNISFNITISNQSQSYVLISGAGIVNWVGNIWGATAFNVGIFKINAAATLNVTGGIKQNVSVNFSHTIVASQPNYTINITGEIGFSLGQSAQIIVLGASGVLNITGSVYGAIGLAVNSTTNITGNVISDGASIINSSGSFYLKIIGSIISNSIVSAIVSTSVSAINIFTGPFISSPTGILPLYVTRMHYQRTFGSYYEFRDNSTNGALPPAGPAPITRLVSLGTAIDAPAASNVRQGVVYAAGSLTGTMVVPAASNVANNVPVDNTVGTAVLDPNAIWAVPLTSINTLNSIGRRVKNAATVETTGAQIQTTLNNNE
jgi:hypothetical protein